MRTLTYKILKDKNHIEPRTRQWAGMQFEDNATEVKFDLSELSLKRALYRIDFNSAGAGYQPSENLVVESNTIRRAVPNYVTQYGGEVQVTAVITILDENGDATGTCLSYPVLIYFTEVDKDAEGSKNAEKNISESEASALDAAERAEKAAQYASESEEAAEEAKEKTEMARRALEEGSEFVFSGGDAFREGEIDLVVDGELSEFSDNPISNKAVAEAVNKLSADYIVEQGKSGIWTYRKWASGLAECWGRTEIRKKSELDSNYCQANVTFPFTFTAYPVCNCSGFQLQNLRSYLTMVTADANNASAFMHCETTASDSFPGVFYFDVKGRWK